MQTTEVSSDQLSSILALQESHFSDLKSKDIKPSKLSETVSALANSSGGEIYVGIDEDSHHTKKRRWRGFNDIEEANAHVAVIEGLAPLANHYECTFLSHAQSSGLVLQINVFKSKDIISATSGKVFLRRGAQNLPVVGDEAISRLKLDKGLISFEDENINAKLEEIANSEVVIDFMLNVIPTAEPETWLKKQRLYQDDAVTVAGVLLFSDEPQTYLPKRSATKIYRYKTTNEEGDRDTLAFDPLTMEGPVYALIRDTVTTTIELVEDIKRLGGKGLESIQYPPETLHEILTNAVLHRDYSIAADIHIRIFDNRIEVESPGKLPGHVTVENILDEQFARNPKIVRMINKFPDPPNKDVGEGLNTAFNAMRKLRLRNPDIIQKDNSVLVVIRHQTLASPEEAIMEYLEVQDEIVNRVGRKITGITSENTMKNVFIRMKNKGLIEPVPGKSGFASAWQKKS